MNCMRGLYFTIQELWIRPSECGELSHQSDESCLGLLPLPVSHWRQIGWPTLGGARRVRGIFLPNSSELVLHPEVHVEKNLEDRMRVALQSATGKVGWDPMNRCDRIC